MRTQTIGIKVTLKEKETWKRLSREMGIPISTLGRNLLIAFFDGKIKNLMKVPRAS